MARRGVDFLNATERSALMRRIRSTGAASERAAIDTLRRARFAVETHARDLPGRPDAVLRRARVAVFVDGLMWHGGQHRRRGLATLDEHYARAERQAQWVAKVRRTIDRDLAQTDALLASGWSVVRLWEHEAEPERLLSLVRAARDGRGRSIDAALPARTLRAEGPALREHPAGWRAFDSARDAAATLRLVRARCDEPREVFWARAAGVARGRSGAAGVCFEGPAWPERATAEDTACVRELVRTLRGGVDVFLAPRERGRGRRLVVLACLGGARPADDARSGEPCRRARPPWVRAALDETPPSRRWMALLPTLPEKTPSVIGWVARHRLEAWLVESIRGRALGARRRGV